ncbi:hypothetical protein L208DRAFT_1232639 [Tricholoma matsutake]|nr:hypothetical protein L208DRAFT_1232639 [Tricholoma matsutake 945]
MLFREIAHSSLGTQLDCKGNHYMTTNNFIIDKSKPKFCLALAKPSCATKNIGILFDNTCSELQNVYQQLTSDEEPNQFAHTDWTKPTNPDTKSPQDIILVYFGPIYNVSLKYFSMQNFFSSDITKFQVPTTTNTLAPIEDDDKAADNAQPNTAHHPAKIPPETSADVLTGACSNLLHYCYTYSCSEEQDIYVGGHYDLHLLSDYSGNLFCHQAAELIQHDMRDVDLHLIPPWEYYDKLRPGTMVLCNVTLHLYQMTITNTKGNQPKMRKTFKLNAETIRVVAKSDLPVKNQQQPVLPTSTTASTTTCPFHSCHPDSTSNSCVLFNVIDNDSCPLPQPQCPITTLNTSMLPALQSQHTQQLSHTDVTPSIGHKDKLEDMLMKINWEESDDELPKSKKSKGKEAMKK